MSGWLLWMNDEFKFEIQFELRHFFIFSFISFIWKTVHPTLFSINLLFLTMDRGNYVIAFCHMDCFSIFYVICFSFTFFSFDSVFLYFKSVFCCLHFQQLILEMIFQFWTVNDIVCCWRTGFYLF